MRQTNAGVLQCNALIFKIMLCMILILFGNAVQLHADITAATLQVEAPALSPGKINGSGLVTLKAQWTGDTPPFSATFKSGDNTLGNETTSTTGATYQVSGAALGHGDGKSFKVILLESSVPNSEPAEAAGNNAVNVDLVAPVLSVSIANGSSFSNTAPNNVVRIRVESTQEDIRTPVISPVNGVNASQEGGDTSGKVFYFTLTLNESFSNGDYNVSVTAKDTSEPAESANTGTGNTTFRVGTGATGSTSINSSTPPSPTNATSISLAGKAPADAKTVEVLDGTNSVATVNITSEDWSVGISPDEGTHEYVAVSRDSLGIEISRSGVFKVIVDRAVPTTPTLSYSGPTTTNGESVTVTVNIPDIETETSPPVKVQAFVNGVAAGTPQSATTSPVTMSVPLVDGTNRITFEVIDAAGNKSTMSDAVNVFKDTTAAEVSGMFISRPGVVASMPLPLDPGYFLGAGIFKLQVNFGKDMNRTVNPVITVQAGGGSILSVSGGVWVASSTFVGEIVVPKNGGAGYDGAASINVSGAVDASGNAMADYPLGNAFTIDSSNAVASFESNDTIFVSASSTKVLLKGDVIDSGGSGVGYVDLVWQSFTGGEVGSESVPIMQASPSPWEKNWDVKTAGGTGLSAGRYKLWVVAADQAKPTPNYEDYTTKPYRVIVYDVDLPVVNRVAIGNMAQDINEMLPQPVVIASAVTRLTARFTESGDSGIDFGGTYSGFTLVHDETGTNIMGNYSNNGSDTIYFDFPELTINGTYTVSVTPVDLGGNVGETASRSFSLDKSAPDSVTFYPADQRIANISHVALEQDQVWATINHPRADHVRSTIEVRYNGNVVGNQVANGSETAVVWDLYGAAGALATNQAHDGRYDITVVPRDTLGNVGSPVRAFFNYDSVPPVITKTVPAITINSSTPVWFGLAQSDISITVSDSPKDAIQYGPNMPAQPSGFSFSGLQIPSDPNWYNSNGSGFNVAVSSFAWSMDSMVSAAPSISGNVMTLNRPGVPENTAEGMADVLVSVDLKDQVNDGQQIPNSMVASYVYRFDYMAPVINEITAPDATNNKYCKNVLTVSGSASDIGASDLIKVSTIEYSQTDGIWSTLPAAGLPSKEASFSANIDISSKTDGTYSIKVRATDLAGNPSGESSVSYVVDRTPPPAPTLIVPLPALRSKNRGQLFKWTAQTSADRYLLQVADDASFNNILNRQNQDAFYGSLVGQVVVMTEGAFSVPKDGTYYWRVAAIETCVDGFNISEFSETRSFVVDTVRPLIVEVQPAPSQGNKISTGMVTFTIRFSELVDTTISPLVKITTAGGQMMAIEKVSYVEDTWTGTTVIPINSSALYDGTAIISIEGATDLAGNVMSADSTSSVVINTGPSFTTRIFSNPANEYEILIVTRSSEALQGPPTVSVRQNSTRTPVTMNFLKERFYAGSYRIDLASPGKAYISLAGTDLYGMVGNDTIEFTVADLSASQRLDISSISGLANLKGAEGSAFGEAVIYMLDRENLESPFESGSMRASVASVMPTTVAQSGSELVPVMALEEIGPASLRLKKRLLYTASLGKEKIKVPPEKVHLYRLNSRGKWVFQGGEVKDGEVSAQISGIGRLALMADMTSPSLREKSPADNERLEDSFPEIKGMIADSGSGLKRDTFKLHVNGIEMPGVALGADGSFAYKVKQALPKGKHEVSLEVDDYAGNSLRQSFWVTAPGPFAADEFMPYPNPATGNVMYFNYNFNQTADTVSLRIYDTAGHKVASFETSDFVSVTNGRFRWDMRNDSGKTVANGVYFYRLTISKGGQTFKKRGKFAVMR
ncbi:MAG: T9SS type A sorting domain-containing protein [Candidatus Riflebacteria bacterium]|nr:T9SS type A sorting domain-containing protein [Candidatus Riflebacteria bacterium]